MYRDCGRFGSQVCALGAIYAATAGEEALQTVELGFCDPNFINPTAEQKAEYHSMVAQLAIVLEDEGFCPPDYVVAMVDDQGLVWRFNDSLYGLEGGETRVIAMMKKAKAKFEPITISPTESEAVEKVTRGWPQTTRS